MNAIKFTPRGGKVNLKLQCVETGARLTITDNGDGISAEFLPYVFHRFRQEEGSISRKAGGLGLGLAVVRHLVELHGGSVLAESAGPGQGSTFMVDLPLAADRRDARTTQEQEVSRQDHMAQPVPGEEPATGLKRAPKFQRRARPGRRCRRNSSPEVSKARE